MPEWKKAAAPGSSETTDAWCALLWLEQCNSGNLSIFIRLKINFSAVLKGKIINSDSTRLLANQMYVVRASFVSPHQKAEMLWKWKAAHWSRV